MPEYLEALGPELNLSDGAAQAEPVEVENERAETKGLR
jgi:hypothetical protein